MADDGNSENNNYRLLNSATFAQQMQLPSSISNLSPNKSRFEAFNRHTNGEMIDVEQRKHEGIIDIAEHDLKLFEHQVSGHGSMEKGLLKHKNGYILKPLQPPPMGTREVSFYQEIHGKRHQQSQEDCYAKLKQFVPNFYGVGRLTSNTSTEIVNENGAALQDHQRQYLLLQDIIEGFNRPCVADVKLGSQTWSPDASEAKIKQERGKYKGTKFPLGICLTGMHYYDIRTNEKCKPGKDYFKTLDPTTLKGALEKFLNRNNSDLYRVLANIVIKKLREVEDVFNVQKSFRLYGSSILIAYDADFFLTRAESRPLRGDADLGLNMADIPLRVFMIDFAHFHPSEGDELYDSLDENYLFGLRNFIKILCDIAEVDPSA